MALTRLGPNQLLNLASNVTGTLPAANGGTGATSFKAGKIVQVAQSVSTTIVTPSSPPSGYTLKVFTAGTGTISFS